MCGLRKRENLYRKFVYPAQNKYSLERKLGYTCIELLLYVNLSTVYSHEAHLFNQSDGRYWMAIA